MVDGYNMIGSVVKEDSRNSLFLLLCTIIVLTLSLRITLRLLGRSRACPSLFFLLFPFSVFASFPGFSISFLAQCFRLEFVPVSLNVLESVNNALVHLQVEE